MSHRKDPSFLVKRAHDANPSTDSSGSEVTTTERELANDAQWKLIQKNTFTRWANEHLKTVNRNIADLETDLADGLRLIALIEVLAGKKFQKYNKRPTIRTQKLENITMALRFLQVEEKIKIVNIDSSNIVDHNLKLILGLIWMLILHYSISMPNWEDEMETTVQKKEQTPKQRLLAWIQNRVPDRQILNFSTDWNDGRAIGALVDGVAPGLCPDWEDWNVRDALPNATEAMDAAEKWLDIPQLIRPEEMCNPKVDELSMMTYLSQFPSAKLKSGAPLRPRTNPSRVRTYGPGLDASGNSVGAPARFTVETFSAGKGELDVTVINPNGIQEPLESVFNNDHYLTYSCCYTPTMEGPYKVHVRFANREIPKSPFVVRVEGVAGDPSKVTASGPGLEKHGIMVKKKTQFDVFTKNAGFGMVDVVVIDPLGDKNSVRPVVSKVTDDEWRVEYVPAMEGLHAINVFFAGSPIPVSPVSIIVTPPIDASKVTARGRGLQGTGLRVGDRAPFEIQTRNAGAGGQLSVKVTGPAGMEENVSMNTVDKLCYDCCYMPARSGRYSVSVNYSGQPIPQSPFVVRVLPARQCRVRAFGPGLTRGMVGHPACFTVETNGETGTLGFSIEGPSQSRIECKDNEDGSAEISYFPLTPGEYAVHILVDNEDINNSPFMAAIQPTSSDFDPSKVKVFGKGLEPVGLIVKDPTQFVIDARMAGKAELNVGLRDVDLNPVEVSVKDNKDGTFLCSYVPTRNVRHMALVAYGGLAIPGSPFRMQVQERSDPSKVKVFGPAFTDKVETFKPTYFVVDCADAGPGDVAIALTDSRHQNVVVKTTDNEDNTFTVVFEPKQVGEYVARVYFGDSEVPVSPMKINVLPSIDLSHVRLLGLDKDVFVESPVEFGVDLRSVGSDPDRRLKVIITAPSGDKMEAVVKNNPDSTSTCSFALAEEGVHSIDVAYGDLPIPGSPLVVKAVNGYDSSKVKAFGPGLNTEGFTGHPQQFKVDTKKAGKGGLGLAIEGPSEAKMTCRDNRDGTCDVEYLPIKRGVYDIAVKFAEEHIPGSPFRVRIKDELNPGRVRCFGSALDPGEVRQGQAVSLVVDASDAGEAPLDITVTDCHGKRQSPDVVSKADGLHEMTYQPKGEGQHKIIVLYGGKPVPDIPFSFSVLPTFEPKRVKVSGEGVRGPVSATLPASFTIDTTEAGEADLKVSIKGAENRDVSFTTVERAPGCLEVTYSTDSLGKLKVDVTYGNEPVTSSPFLVDVAPVGQIDNVKIVGGVRSVVPVGELSCLVVDRSTGGTGRVTSRVTGGGTGNVKTEVTETDDGMSEVKYVLPEEGVYDVQLKFGGQSIPEGSFEQRAVSAEDYLKEQEALLLSKSVSSGLANGVIQNGFDGVDSTDGMSGLYNPVNFTIAVGPIFGFVKAEVTTPSGDRHLPKIIDNRNGTVTIRYEPTEVGLHQMNVTYNDFPVDGSPFEFSVDAVRAGNVTAHGSGLAHGVAGTKCSFVINTANLGTNGLVVLVEGPSKTDIHVEDNDDNTCTVSYTPMLPGDYQVFIKFANKDIAGSPFSTRIIPASGDDLQVVNMMIGSNKSEISLMVIEPDVDLLTASVRCPSGKESPCLLKSLINGQLGISFSAKETGVHLVNVLRSGQHVKNSPFRMNIHEGQLCRVDRVRAFGKGLTDGRTNEFCEFFVNCKDAGFGNLSLSIEGPGRALMNCQEDEVGLCHVRYKPLQPGIYVINVRFADDHINGSPFLVQVKGRPTDLASTETSDVKDNADITHVGCECLLRLAIDGINLKDLEATVLNPSFVLEVCRVNELSRGNYAISFVPQEIGVHRVNVRNRGFNIPGSPFRFTVGPIMEGGADRVQVIGMGLESGKVNSPGQFGIYTKEAGAGNLSVVMEGPSKAVIDIQDRLDGSCDVTYHCSQPGDYLLFIKFNGDDVPNSPFRIPVASCGEEDSTVSLNEDNICQVNRPTSLLLSMGGEGEQGSLKATVVDPEGVHEPAFVQQLNHGRFAVRFVPHSNGLHKIHVTRNGSTVKGSPFLLIVGKPETNPALVRAQGEGLTKGWTGKPARFTVQTLDAGPGSLAVSVDGPSKVEVNCDEMDDGYELTYTPRAPGLYQISLTYGGDTHIPNSPFVVHVEGPGRPSAWNEQSQVIVGSQTKNKKMPREHDLTNGFDHRDEESASLIASQGPGLHKGLINKVSTFNVDTSHAGQGILLIGVMGPSGPCEEVTIKHLGSGHYAVSYQPKERGNYLVVVRWGERHVPGSPFHVLVQ